MFDLIIIALVVAGGLFIYFRSNKGRAISPTYAGPTEDDLPTDRFRTISRVEEQDLPDGVWYRCEHWHSTNLYVMKNEAPADWNSHDRKTGPGLWRNEFSVVGLRYEGRADKLSTLARLPGFAVDLVPDPLNEHDKNAVEVYATASGKRAKQIGFLAREDARSLRNAGELKALPASISFPSDDYPLSFKIRIYHRPIK